MSLTRKFLSALGIEAEKVDEIIIAHSETVNALKEERDGFKKTAESNQAAADELKTVKAELDDLKKSTENDEWETKYNDLKSEYDTYKSDVKTKEEKRAKVTAYRKLLKDTKISEKRLDSIIKISGEAIDKIELEKDGSIKDSDKIAENIKSEWGEFIVTEQQIGANTPKPPANETGSPKKESRAAKLAEQYHNNIYGESKKEV